MPQVDTIFALSSGRPPAAIGVVRISGPQAEEALRQVIGRVPGARRATLATVRDPRSDEIVDEGLALWFPGPASETGEDVAELQVHGGRAVVAAVLRALAAVPGCRMAEPGEFTRRAFHNGKLDLTRVEGLADLIGAETEAQRKQALRLQRGALAGRAEEWRGRLVEARALVEAGIDFSDEGDVPEDLAIEATAAVRAVAGEIRGLLGRSGERLREGLQVAIAGPPNVGKSTLLNRIARREVAIVSPQAGTTRDLIEVHLDLGGYPVTLRDGAGIREADDVVEQEGVRRARASARDADLVLWVVDAAAAKPAAAEDISPAAAECSGKPTWIVLNKCDCAEPERLEAVATMVAEDGGPVHRVSAQRGDGIDALIGDIAGWADETFAGEAALVTRERQREMLAAGAAALDGAIALVEQYGVAGREELVAEQIRLATRALERLVGRVDVEDVLDVIFRDFCVGK